MPENCDVTVDARDDALDMHVSREGMTAGRRGDREPVEGLAWVMQEAG
jgi:hypothetical protein